MNILELQYRSHHRAQLFSTNIFPHSYPNAFIDQNIDDTARPPYRRRYFDESGQALSFELVLPIPKRTAG
jgi:hypothetical protein